VLRDELLDGFTLDETIQAGDHDRALAGGMVIRAQCSAWDKNRCASGSRRPAQVPLVVG
jgi:hypothetical protein